MTKEHIIEQTVQLLQQLPESKAAEIRDFAAFLLQRKKTRLKVSEQTDPSIVVALKKASIKHPAATPDTATTIPTDKTFATDLKAIISHSKSYDFLNEEPDLYTDSDLIESYR